MPRFHIPRKYDALPSSDPDASSSQKSYTPIKGSDRPHHLSKPKKNRPLVYLADGMTLTQEIGLAPIAGQVGFAGDRPQDNTMRPPPMEAEKINDLADPESSNGLMFVTSPAPAGLSPEHGGPSRHQRRRQNQTERWLLIIIPKLILPYMKLVNETECFRLDVKPSSTTLLCSCGGDNYRSLKVMIIRFHVIESIDMQICRCCPAARQLVSRGLFPCAPVVPSLAVDIRVLEFVSRLFLNISPNTTAWCKTVEGFLESQGYHLSTKDSLRKRFGEALRWFNTLQDHMNSHINNILYHTRRLATDYDDGCHSDSESEIPRAGSLTPCRGDDSDTEHTPQPQLTPEPPSTPVSNSRKRPASSSSDDEGFSNPFPEPLPRARPSDYLRSRCPLCFGGNFPRRPDSKGPDIIVCVDACFKQKRNAGGKDPAREHPETIFISQNSSLNMEEYVDEVRPPKPSNRSRATKRSRKNTTSTLEDDPEDGYDGSLRVPRSVLATCQESFTAADDHRQKASTQFFSETALMALLCRHDRVLWIVSMTSAGEKQHYVLVLLETLFQHIPRAFIVGLLYDIGCQIHESCVKWGFLDRYLSRLLFAISVFHAFGHQWACQIIYHPRKCVGFGLSDGEGCERLWKSLQILIPYLRVCGHYQRLYTLDRQILHAEHQSLHRFGQWLLRRTRHCQDKRLEAEQILKDCGQDLQLLRREWKAQVESQTKPLPRQSKNKGKDVIERTLQLRKARDILKNRIRELEDTIADELSEDYAIAEAELSLPEARARFENSVVQVQAAEHALGVNDRAKLKRLVNNPFISARMNARALKIRLREKLRSRKFELDRLERSFRHQVNERKVDQHVESSVQRRDPGIQKLARDYNKLCKTMKTLKAQRKAPQGAVCPEEIELSGIFALDVDDDIWQDIGLDDTLDDPNASAPPPPWLCNENVRSGIKAMLQLDRCIEEEERLGWERSSLQVWYAEEWEIVGAAYKATDGPELRYQLQLRKDKLLSLLMEWRKPLQSVLPSESETVLPEWGPTKDEILQARILENTTSTVNDFFDESDYSHTENIDHFGFESNVSSDYDDEDMELDSALIDTLEAVDLADAFRQEALK